MYCIVMGGNRIDLVFTKEGAASFLWCTVLLKIYGDILDNPSMNVTIVVYQHTGFNLSVNNSIAKWRLTAPDIQELPLLEDSS